MATSSYCATANGAELFTHYASNSRLIGFNSRNRSSKLFLTRTSDFRGVKRCFHVKSVSSEPKQNVQDPVTEEGLILTPNVSLFLMSNQLTIVFASLLTFLFNFYDFHEKSII